MSRLILALSMLSLLGLTLAQAPTLQPLFNVTLTLGSSNPPVLIPGGATVAVPILNGSVVSTSEQYNIAAEISGGLAYPRVYENGTVQDQTVVVYGNSAEGDGFLIEEDGVAVKGVQITRIRLTVGGQYQELNDKFLIAYGAASNGQDNAPITRSVYILT